MAANIHVVPHEDHWDVKEEGSDREVSKHRTQAEAETAGRDLASRNGVELLIHGKDGTIIRRDSHGHDPRNIPG